MENEELLKNAKYKSLILNMCVPTIMIMLVMVIYNMADTFFVGKTGNPNMIAAISLCGPLFSIMSGVGTLFGSGGCTAISLALGEKNYRKIKNITSVCFYGALFIGVIFLIIVNGKLSTIATIMGADADTLKFTMDYLRILAWGAPIILYANVFTNLIRADGAAKQSMVANGIGTLVNIILDPILIIGMEMGATGAAIATVAGNLLSAVYLIYYVKKVQTKFSISIKDVLFKKEIILPIISLGLPLAFSTILMSFSTILLNNIMIQYGALAVAANNIVGKAGMLITMLIMGVCMGIQPAISYNYSAKNIARMKMIVRNTGFFSVIVGSVVTLICLLFQNQIIMAFIDNKEVIELCKKMYLAAILVGPIYGLYQTETVYLQSIGKAGRATVVALLDKGIIFIPMMFFLNRLSGLYGLIYTSFITDLISIMIGAVLCLTIKRKNL